MGFSRQEYWSGLPFPSPGDLSDPGIEPSPLMSPELAGGFFINESPVCQLFVRTGHGTMDWFQIGKGVRKGCMLSPCLFNSYAEYLMQNARLDEAQAGIRIAGRNINNLRFADDTTLMAESEEELKSLLRKVKEESEKVGLKLSIQKTKIMSSGSITLWQIDGETMEIVTDFIFLGSKITANGDYSHEIKRCLLLLSKKKSYDPSR